MVYSVKNVVRPMNTSIRITAVDSGLVVHTCSGGFPINRITLSLLSKARKLLLHSNNTSSLSIPSRLSVGTEEQIQES